jgi:hypothetical protein
MISRILNFTNTFEIWHLKSLKSLKSLKFAIILRGPLFSHFSVNSIKNNIYIKNKYLQEQIKGIIFTRLKVAFYEITQNLLKQ